MIRFRSASALCLISAVALTTSPVCSSAAEFAELARYLPSDANAVVVVNAAALYASPIGQRESWKAKYADAFEASPLLLPPSAERCVLAAALDFSTLQPDWEAAAIEASIDPSTGDIARRRGGSTDSLAGVAAVWLGGKTCVLKFAPRTFGLMTPATRQEAARWAQRAKANESSNFSPFPESSDLSPYLRQAIGYADTVGTELILAVDLSNTFHEAKLRAAATQSDVLKDNNISPDQAAAMLASIQGVKMGVLVGDRLNGRLQLDFSQDVGPLAAVAKPLVLRIVAKAGAMLDEFNNWTADVQDKSIAIKGELTPDGMRRIFSLLSLDAGKLESAEPAVEASAAPTSADAAKEAMGKASLRYFRGVSKYIEDIQRLQRANSLDQAVMWIENYARKVERLPARGVDPELVEYGKYVAQTFRSIVDQASGLADQLDAQGSGPVVTNYRIGMLPTARTVNYGGDYARQYVPYGYADVDPQATQETLQKTQDQIYQAVQSAQQALSQLAADHETVRKKLTERYGLPF
jgi:hypothetical protein